MFTGCKKTAELGILSDMLRKNDNKGNNKVQYLCDHHRGEETVWTITVSLRLSSLRETDGKHTSTQNKITTQLILSEFVNC